MENSTFKKETDSLFSSFQYYSPTSIAYKKCVA